MSQNPLKHLNILLVEDEEKIRQHIATSLRYIVNNVQEAGNGKEALALLENFSPDLIITDLEMPIMNGVDFIKTLRKAGSKICVVVLTAHTSNDYLLPLIDAHIEQYIVKPINFEKMLTVLHQCYNRLNELKCEKTLLEEYVYDWDKKTLTCNDNFIALTKKEIAFLELLFKNINRTVTYSELQEYVWGG